VESETNTQIELQRQAEQLGRREKALACLYDLSDLIEQPGLSLDALLAGAVRLLPPAWRFPEAAGARIVLDGRDFQTDAYRETEWRLTADLVIHGRRSGCLEVGYREPRPWGAEGPFLPEERRLLAAAAQRLGHTVERMQLDEELRTSRERLDVIIDSVPAYIAYTDADLNILYLNRALAEWWGYSKEQAVGKSFREVARPGGYALNAPHFRQAVASRQTVTHELRSVSATGQAIVGRAASVPHLDEQGNVQGLVVLILDITEQRRAEEALRASEERFRLVVANMQEGVAIVDDAGKLVYVNDRLCEMTGRARDDMVGQPSAQLFISGEQELHRDQLARRRAGLSDRYESVFVHKDGAQLPVLITASPVKDALGTYRGGSAVVTDTAVQKQAERALIQAKEAAEAAQAAAERARLHEQERRHESERRQRLAEGLADVLAALNAKRSLDDVLNLVVRRARRLLTAEAAAIYSLEGPGETLRVHATQGLIGALFSETSSRAIRALLQEAIAVRRPVLAAETSSEEGGSFLAAPILLGEQPYGALMVYHCGPRSVTVEDKELSALMAAQAALAVENTRLRAEAEAAARDAERTRLARELHDSVTQALFSASLISEALPRVWERHPQEARRALDELCQLTHGALAEMRTLLLELRPAALLAQPLDVLIAQLADAMSARTRIPVVVAMDGDCTLPEEVKLAVYRIAQEALNNVVKHARAGRVRIELRCKPERVTLSVHDDGRGFDPAGIESHHLGLGIMRERAKAVGARLTVDSRPGQGSTVTVSYSAG
jgi:PAS domain S-box-containing protein